MKDEKEIAELEAEIARDEKSYSAAVQIEVKILKNISRQGFAAACQRVRLRSEQQALSERIRRNKIMLAWADA